MKALFWGLLVFNILLGLLNFVFFLNGWGIGHLFVTSMNCAAVAVLLYVERLK